MIEQNIQAEQPKQSLRLFIAVDMPPAVKEEVLRIQNYVKKKELLKGKFTAPDQIHITLKFLGDVPAELLPKIDGALKTIYLNTMKAQLGSLDLFSSGKIIKILFLNVVCPELSMLAKEIEERLGQWFEPERRPFVSHVTLARIKGVEDRERLAREINHCVVNPLSFEIDQFVLKQSVLLPEGPIYTDIAVYKLY